MSREINNELLKKLAMDSMIKLTDEEVNIILDSEKDLIEKMDIVKGIDTEGVEPMYSPFDDSNVYLREDDDFKTIDQKLVLKNAPTTDGDFVTITKVVK